MNDAPPDAATIAALLAPIAGDTPAGRDVRREGEYVRISEARRDENANLPRGVWMRDLKQADWALVERLCSETLTRRSKDLRVACWLCEAWVQRHRFAGLAAGLALLDALCRGYWEGLHPALEGDDPAARVVALEWLNERLPVVIRRVPILGEPSGREGGYSWSDQLAAARLDAVRRQDAGAAAKAEAGGAVTLAMIDAARDRTATEPLRSAADGLNDALHALAALDATLDARCGREAPGLGKIRTAVADIHDFIEAALALRVQLPTPPAPVVVDLGAERPSDLPSRTPALSRAAAYRQIAEIAQALHRIEPHSPVPELLDRIAGWGALSLREIDQSLREHNSEVSLLLEVLGFLAEGGGSPIED